MNEEGKTFWQMFDDLVQAQGKDAQEAIRMAGIRSTLTELFAEEAAPIIALLEGESMAFWDAVNRLARIGVNSHTILPFIEKAKSFGDDKKDFMVEFGAALIVAEIMRVDVSGFAKPKPVFESGGIVSPHVGGARGNLKQSSPALLKCRAALFQIPPFFL